VGVGLRRADVARSGGVAMAKRRCPWPVSIRPKRVQAVTGWRGPRELNSCCWSHLPVAVPQPQRAGQRSGMPSGSISTAVVVETDSCPHAVCAFCLS
jgi:hypothetical protein